MRRGLRGGRTAATIMESMPDPKIERYLRENIAHFPMDTLKAHLIKGGSSPADVEAAALAITNPSAGPAGDGGESLLKVGETPVKLTITQLPYNSILLVRNPAALFRRLDDNGSIMRAAVYTFCWIILAYTLLVASYIISTGPAYLWYKHLLLYILMGLIMGVSFGLLTVIGQFMIAGIYHAVLSGLGGKTAYTRAFRILSVIAPVNSLWILAPQVPFVLSLGLCQAALLAAAAKYRFQLSTQRAVVVFICWLVVAGAGYHLVFHSFSSSAHFSYAKLRHEIRSKKNLGEYVPYTKSSDPAYIAYDSGRYVQARDLWLRSARSMDPDSLYSLGTLYWMGRGVPRDAAEAYKWYVLAAFMGDSKAGETAMKVRGQIHPVYARTGIERAQSWLGLRFSTNFARRYHKSAVRPAAIGVDHERR